MRSGERDPGFHHFVPLTGCPFNICRSGKPVVASLDKNNISEFSREMGNSVCCGFEGEDNSDVTLQQLALAGLKELPAKVYDAWLKKYSQGSSVEVLFPDGQRIECKLTLDSAKRILTLVFKEKVRPIPYKDIDSWIYGPSAVDQASADAKLLKDPKVVGFRLSTSGRAIAVAFDSTDSAVCFVRFLEQTLEQTREQEAHTNGPTSS